MVDALVGPQFVKLVLLNAGVGPVNVPVDVFVRVEAEIEPATRLFDDTVLSLGSAKNEFLDLLLDLLAVVVLLLVFVLKILLFLFPFKSLFLFAPLLKLFCNLEMSVVRNQSETWLIFNFKWRRTLGAMLFLLFLGGLHFALMRFQT